MNIHDSGYKILFSNRTIFRQLIQTFVEEEWVQRLDFARAVRIDKSFVSEEYQESEADLIYQVPLLGGVGAVIFYLLIEFQSTVERFMALRSADYLTSFYQDYRRSDSRVKLLPQIFPIVLYNGSDRWNAPETLAALMEQHVDLGDFGVQARYFPIIINQMPLAKLAAELNVVSTIFMAEAHYDSHRVVEKIVELYDQEDPLAVSLLANWFMQMATHKRIPREDRALLEQEIRSRKELETMLVDALKKEDEMKRQIWLKEGIEIGEARGEARGEVRGKALGKAERERQIARAMIANDYPVASIAHLLAISEEDVMRLLAEDENGAA